MTISPNKWELDVQGYLNVCNITSATPRQQIRDFAKGVNDLGLWNSMVCWPLRSSQNYGSGTTAFSLGGLGTYNGTLVNGPTFEAAGLQLDGTNDYLNTNLTPSATDNVSVFVVSRRTSGAFGDAITQLQQFLYVSRNDAGSAYSASDTSARISSLGQSELNVVSSAAIQKLSGQGPSFWRNGALLVQLSLVSTLAAASQPVLVGARNSASPGVFFTGTIPFAFYCAGVSVDMAQLNTLYKDTLGQGLGLP
jgi:hypothetical protein